MVEQVYTRVGALGNRLSFLPDRSTPNSQAFFQMWWDEQAAAMQEATRGLVASGQLEFINGGWAM